MLLRFEYAYVGLPALDATEYVAGPNLLGVALAALMRVPAEDRARLKAEGLERIAISGENEARKYLFAECFDNYLKLGETERAEYERLQAERFVEGKTMATGWLEQGRVRGLREAACKQLEKKFGPLGPDVPLQLDRLPIERIEQLLIEILDAESLDDLGLEAETPAPDSPQS